MVNSFNREDWKNNFTWEKRLHKEKKAFSQDILANSINCRNTKHVFFTN